MKWIEVGLQKMARNETGFSEHFAAPMEREKGEHGLRWPGNLKKLVVVQTKVLEEFKYKSLFVKVWICDLKILYYGELKNLLTSVI
jgi:hypothetical protein